MNQSQKYELMRHSNKMSYFVFKFFLYINRNYKRDYLFLKISEQFLFWNLLNILYLTNIIFVQIWNCFSIGFKQRVLRNFCIIVHVQIILIGTLNTFHTLSICVNNDDFLIFVIHTGYLPGLVCQLKPPMNIFLKQNKKQRK